MAVEYKFKFMEDSLTSQDYQVHPRMAKHKWDEIIKTAGQKDKYKNDNKVYQYVINNLRR